ncbi:MAG: GntR family transcriptional regulator [Chloroflexi bacterium]|nr:GntR family transcriptional regulator [Chloroflexota bacterium]MCL5075383.1 GntR family transcriptional regulator [Chloroflexota bacterium]
MNLKIGGPPLYSRGKRVLTEFIREGESLKGSKLPSEQSLAEQLGVGRSTIREALATLEKEGIVTKKHGLGNFVHYSALEAKMRIDLIPGFIALIEDAGYVATSTQSNPHVERTIDLQIARYLNLTPSEDSPQEVFVFDRTYFANGGPAIFSTTYIPCPNLQTLPAIPFQGGFIDFLEEHCGQEIAHAIIWFIPTLADSRLSDILQIDPTNPLIEWEELYYTLEDRPVCFVRIFFNPHFMKLCMLRKVSKFRM